MDVELGRPDHGAGLDPVARVDAALARRGTAWTDEDRRAATALAEGLSSVDEVQDLPDDTVVLKRLLARKVRQRLDGWGRLLRFEGVVAEPEGVLELPDDPALIKLMLAWETAACRIVEQNRVRFPTAASRRQRKGRLLRESELEKLPPGRHSDNQGHGLTAVVRECRGASGARAGARRSVRWVVRLTCPWLQGTGADSRRDYCLGSWPAVPLEQARAKARDHYRLVRAGKDPVKELARPTVTVRELFDQVIAAKAADWKGGGEGKTAVNYRRLFHRHVDPVLGSRPVVNVSVAELEGFLKPLAKKYDATAGHVLLVLHAIFDRARALELRSDNLSRAARPVLGRLKRQPRSRSGIPIKEASAAYAAICGYRADSSRAADIAARQATRVVALTVKRVSEAVNMRWDEIRWDKCERHVPWERMKGPVKEKSRNGAPGCGAAPVPVSEDSPEYSDWFYVDVLSPEVMEILAFMREWGPGTERVFDFDAGGSIKCVSRHEVGRVMKQLGLPGTPHGWRATFRTWAEGLVEDPPRVQASEMALAHKVGTQVGKRYDKQQFTPERKVLMKRWEVALHSGCNGVAVSSVGSVDHGA